MTENNQPNAQESKRLRGGQAGNQNARTHGRYSLVISPRTKEALKVVMALDHRGQQLIFAQLLRKLVEAREAELLESHSFPPVPEKAEPIPLTADFDREFAAWAKERNIDNDEFMPEVRKTNQG